MEPRPKTEAATRHAADADALRRGLRFTEEFHMRSSPVHHTLSRLVQRLEDAGVRYAIIGAMALNGHGVHRATVDIDVLLSPDGLRSFKDAWLGRGYVETFEGSRGVRDTESGVPIDFLLAGDYPGDGRPKSVRFPAPEEVGEAIDGIVLARLESLIELKLASGISAPDRLRDLADVLELIRVRGLPEDLAERLDPSVRAKYRELWQAAQPTGDD